RPRTRLLYSATMRRDKDVVRLVLVLSRRQIRFALGAVLLAAAGFAAAETLTMVASYPSPLGIYNSIISAGNAFLARDSGNVGIGTSSPTAKLDVVGAAKVSGAVTAGGTVAGPTVQASFLQLNPQKADPAAADGKVI